MDLVLALIGLLAFFAFHFFAGPTPGVSAQTANSVTVPASISVPEEAASFPMTFTGDPGANVNVSVSFTNGSATGGSDCATAGTDFDNDAPATQTLTAGQSS